MSAPIFRRSDGVWLNEPERWSALDDSLQIVTDEATDFWRETHYGFSRDSGHFLAFPTVEAFTVELRVQSDFQALYDQAGIMVRIDAQRWVKAGIEFSDGRAMLASVLTDGDRTGQRRPMSTMPATSGCARPSRTACFACRLPPMASSGRLCGWRHSPRQTPILWGRWPAHPSGRD